MKRFIHAIWGLVLWIVSLVDAVVRGKTVVLPREDNHPAPALPPAEIVISPPTRSWVTQVTGLVLYTKDGARELCFAATSQPSAKQLRDVRIWIFPERHPAGIEFIIVARESTKRKNYSFWPLVPSSEWYEKASETRLPSSLFPTNVSRIELREDETHHTFLVSADQEWFYPANNEKRRCQVV
jgi:hypothetical protein